MTRGAHSAHWPEYLSIPADRLAENTSVRILVVEDSAALADHLAEAMIDEIQAAARTGRAATLIVPVGPVNQYPLLAARINDRRIDCRNVMLMNMDEYLTDAEEWIDIDHPLSFRGHMQRAFYDRLDPQLAPRPANRVFPDPANPTGIASMIRERGGVDAVFGGIGINGHIAFNEPPEPGGAEMTVEQFAALPTRALALSRETRTINANTVGGDISVIPRRAITVGMAEILAAAKLRFYCNRPWQSAVVRRALHGPIAAACPASLLRVHHDAHLVLTRPVAHEPDIRLR